MKIAPHSKLLFIGDSITDCERARPIGEGLFGAVGKGYVALVEGLLGAIKPAHAIRVVNMGSSGNTVLDLKARWSTDVLALKPDWLVVMIGVNDVWRQFDLPRQKEIHVLAEVYAQTLDELVAETRPSVKGMVLMSPFYIEPNRADRMRSRMDEYGAIMRETAARHGAMFVDTQAAFDGVLEHVHANALAWDRVHPNITGHAIIARAFLDAVGVPM
ncbi:MAG: Lipolytic protein family [Verrucomicrobia bacterium]|nr:Lipolytic protein family [Verrucomicrobiota bacterium]